MRWPFRILGGKNLSFSCAIRRCIRYCQETDMIYVPLFGRWQLEIALIAISITQQMKSKKQKTKKKTNFISSKTFTVFSNHSMALCMQRHFSFYVIASHFSSVSILKPLFSSRIFQIAKLSTTGFHCYSIEFGAKAVSQCFILYIFRCCLSCFRQKIGNYFEFHIEFVNRSCLSSLKAEWPFKFVFVEPKSFVAFSGGFNDGPSNGPGVQSVLRISD